MSETHEPETVAPPKDEAREITAPESAAPAKTPTAKKADAKKADAKKAGGEIVPLYGWTFYLNRWLYKRFFELGRWKVYGRENVPKTGAVILAPNHASLFDPPLVGCASPRRVITMGKAELFDQKWLGFKILGYVIQRMATFPVRRGAPDRRALRRAAQVLKDGEALVIFPEGTRTRSGELGGGEIGLAMIAHNAKAPIVPMYLGGTGAALSPRHRGPKLIRVEVRFGAPLHFEEEYARRADRATLEAITQKVMQEIARLRAQADIR